MLSVMTKATVSVTSIIDCRLSSRFLVPERAGSASRGIFTVQAALDAQSEAKAGERVENLEEVDDWVCRENPIRRQHGRLSIARDCKPQASTRCGIQQVKEGLECGLVPVILPDHAGFDRWRGPLKRQVMSALASHLGH